MDGVSVDGMSSCSNGRFSVVRQSSIKPASKCATNREDYSRLKDV